MEKYQLGSMKRQCLKVGITGGIGSGKSTVCQIFAALGIPVYDADTEAKLLMVNDMQLRAKIVALFGEAAYRTDGSLDRTFLAKCIFNDGSLREKMNAIVHPAVRQSGKLWHEQQAQREVPYTLKEAALLIESGSYRDLDILILVTAPIAIRIKRVQKRDGMSVSEIKSRLKSQLTDRQRRPFAQFFIQNSGKKALIPQVMKIHRKLMKQQELLPR
jgi:dephospho-CoA kinase